jgi:hypothetical protein
MNPPHPYPCKACEVEALSAGGVPTVQSLQRSYGLTAARALDVQRAIRNEYQLAGLLEDYAHNCPAEIDGGPGLEGPLYSGAAALRLLTLRKTRADALRSEMCRLASWSQTPQLVAEALMAAVEADNRRIDMEDERS